MTGGFVTPDASGLSSAVSSSVTAGSLVVEHMVIDLLTAPFTQVDAVTRPVKT
jgi:hypothetical protein